MLAGIGIIIILKQIPHAVGYDMDYEGSLALTNLMDIIRFQNYFTCSKLLAQGPLLLL